MMHIDNNKRLFLDMQEHPENYSDEQLEVMMNDIDRDPDTDAVWNQFVQKGSGNVSAARKWLKIAAMFICILLMTGIALAAYKTIVVKNNEPVIQKELNPQNRPASYQESSNVRFDNIQLDSVLRVIAQYYQKQIIYHNDSVRYHRMLIEWNQAETLDSFILLINNFDGIHISESNDSIIVE